MVRVHRAVSKRKELHRVNSGDQDMSPLEDSAECQALIKLHLFEKTIQSHGKNHLKELGEIISKTHAGHRIFLAPVPTGKSRKHNSYVIEEST